MEDFLNNIRRLAEAKMASGPLERENPSADFSFETESAMSLLFELGLEASVEFNKTIGRETLYIYKIPPVIMSVFLNFQGVRTGFSIIGSDNYAVFVDNPPSGILVLGKKNNDTNADGLSMNSTLQLISLAAEIEGEDVILKDTTGRKLDPREIMTLIITWVVG